MKERPIIFSTDMVKAILDGRKTMTRRVVKPRKPAANPISSLSTMGGVYSFADIQAELEYYNEHGPSPNSCPYGQVGDRLWVRETSFQPSDGKIIYKADYDHPISPAEWRPSIHMFREDARILLEITEVRVERVQEISLADCSDEGLLTEFHQGDSDGYSLVHADLIGKFQSLWDTINDKRGYGWDTNPWVWVISFKVI